MRRSLLICLLFSASAIASEQVFESGSEQNQLIELYSSQGCSSCPPAERWISRLKSHPRLWHDYIPVVFHVDYWNYLGWKDPFSSAQFSDRQRAYHKQQSVRSVYTPGFIINGSEWRGWFRGQDITVTKHHSGHLKAVLNGRKLEVSFEQPGEYRLFVSQLASGVSTSVIRGENAGKQLSEDFIALNLLTSSSSTGHWNLLLPEIPDNQYKQLAIAIWISQPPRLTPIQATGGWIH